MWFMYVQCLLPYHMSQTLFLMRIAVEQVSKIFCDPCDILWHDLKTQAVSSLIGLCQICTLTPSFRTSTLAAAGDTARLAATMTSLLAIPEQMSIWIWPRACGHDYFICKLHWLSLRIFTRSVPTNRPDPLFVQRYGQPDPPFAWPVIDVLQLFEGTRKCEVRAGCWWHFGAVCQNSNVPVGTSSPLMNDVSSV